MGRRTTKRRCLSPPRFPFFGLVGVSGRIRGISRGKTPDERLTNGLIQCCGKKQSSPKRDLYLCRGEQVPCTVAFENLISLPQGQQPSANFLRKQRLPQNGEQPYSIHPSLQLVPILSSGRSIIKRSVRTLIEDFIGLLNFTSFSIFSPPCSSSKFSASSARTAFPDLPAAWIGPAAAMALRGAYFCPFAL